MEGKQKILIIDDELDILEFVAYNLEKEGFDVLTTSDSVEGLELAKSEKPNLVLLDVMMPGMDGMEVCQELRKIPELDTVLIVFFTARAEYYSQIEGFKSGADAYLTKPIQPKLLVAHLQALFKRRALNSLESQVEALGGIEIDKSKRLVYEGGRTIILTKLEFNLLNYLTTKPGSVFTRDQIFKEIWGVDSEISDRTIDVHIRKLREKIGDKCILTMKGVGYRFNEKF